MSRSNYVMLLLHGLIVKDSMFDPLAIYIVHNIYYLAYAYILCVIAVMCINCKHSILFYNFDRSVTRNLK